MKMRMFLNGLLLAAIWVTSACKENETMDSVPPNDQDGAVTQVGAPRGERTVKSIGPSGGEISDESGRIKVVIPAGALAAPTEISVQPISNFSAGKRGEAFRLLPHGQIFDKPVTISFQYNEQDVNGTLEQALGIAYQNDRRVWMAVGNVQHDTIANLVQVQTNHFSDWALFAAVELTPQIKGLSPGGQAAILVHYHFKPKDNDDLLAPLVQDTETSLQNTEALLDPKYIVGWEKQGEGNLQVIANKAKYSAPAKIPAKNPVEIVVKIREGNAVGLLISKIYVAPEGISVSVNDGEWRPIPGGGYNGSGGINLIAASASGQTVKILYPGKMFGQYAWTLTTVSCTYTVDEKQIYYHIYGGGPEVSKGYLNVTCESDQQGEIQDLVLGTFDIPTSGCLDTRSQIPDYSTQKLRGVFRVPRIN
jgi:hypothetical protein